MMRDMPILTTLSCTLPEGDVDQRRVEVGRLFARSQQTIEVPDGVELEFGGDETTARALFDFVLFERLCCAQLSFELRFIPDHRAVRLRITGAPELVVPIRAFSGLSG